MHGRRERRLAERARAAHLRPRQDALARRRGWVSAANAPVRYGTWKQNSWKHASSIARFVNAARHTAQTASGSPGWPGSDTFALAAINTAVVEVSEQRFWRIMDKLLGR